VKSVSGSRSSPIHSSGNARALVLPPHIQAEDTPEGRAAWANHVTPEYFDTLGIRLLRGRVFTDQDVATSVKVAVVNETMARFWVGNRDPLGQTLSFRGDPDDIITIVGVVEDTHQMNLRESPPRTVYTPLAQTTPTPSQLMIEIRTEHEPAALAASAREAVRAVSKDVVIRYVRTIEEQINASLVRERLLATLSSGFALLALVLSAVGLYGVMSYSVTRRSREIGIRMALGAARARVLWQVLQQTAAMSIAGVALGIAAAFVATKTLTTFLFGLSPRDPVTLAGVCLVLFVTSLLAGWLPARRAAGLDPLRAIRTE
jgi:predicted permease